MTFKIIKSGKYFTSYSQYGNWHFYCWPEGSGLTFVADYLGNVGSRAIRKDTPKDNSGQPSELASSTLRKP